MTDFEEAANSSLRMQIISRETSMVYPQTPTPEHTILPCSISDNLSSISISYVRTMYIYREASSGDHNDAAAKLKAALTKLLVAFYPMAGRVRPAEGKLGYEIVCNDKGVVWIDAQVDGTIDDFHNFQSTSSITFDMAGKLLAPKAAYSMRVEELPVQYIQVRFVRIRFSAVRF